MRDQFLFARGLEKDIPNLGEGEPVVTKDTKRMWLGTNEGRMPIPNKPLYDYTIYVDPVIGSDINNNGKIATPFKTIQKAWDSLPDFIDKKIRIFLKNGRYNENYLDASEMPRPAILFASGKFVKNRTFSQSSLILDGYVIIEGESKTGVVIETTDAYNYGVYHGQGQLGIVNCTIQAQATGSKSATLLASHRNDVYTHVKEIIIEGNNNCVIGHFAESGAVSELVEVDIKNCDTGVLTFDECIVNLSGVNETGCAIGISNKGYTYLYYDTVINDKVVISDGTLESVGLDTVTQCIINGDVEVYNGGTLKGIYSEINKVSSEGRNVYLSNCDLKRTIVNQGGESHIISCDTDTADSYAFSTSIGGSLILEGNMNVKTSPTGAVIRLTSGGACFVGSGVITCDTGYGARLNEHSTLTIASTVLVGTFSIAKYNVAYPPADFATFLSQEMCYIKEY